MNPPCGKNYFKDLIKKRQPEAGDKGKGMVKCDSIVKNIILVQVMPLINYGPPSQP